MTHERVHKESIADSIVGAGATIEKVLRHMNKEAAMIVDEDERLCGLVTDGDLRRAFLNGADMSTRISEIMTASPLSIREGLSRDEILSLMLGKKIRHLPVIDEDGRPVGMELLKEQYEDSDFPEAVLMAGGKGTRLHPLTFECPKPLLNVGERPILDDILSKLGGSGVNDVIIAINYMGDKIKEHVDDGAKYGMNVAYVRETKSLGTAGALSLLTPKPSRSFIVMNADLITELDYRAFGRFHKDHGNDLSVCVRQVSQRVPYGVVSLDEAKQLVEDIQEKPEHKYLVNAGIYMLEPKVVDLVPKNEFFDMVSLIRKAVGVGLRVGAFPVYEYWRDIGRHQEMRVAERELRKRNGGRHDGVPGDQHESEVQ